MNVLYNALLIALALGLLFGAKAVAPGLQRAWHRRRSQARTVRCFGTPLDPKALADRPELLRRASERVENVGFAPATVTALRESPFTGRGVPTAGPTRASTSSSPPGPSSVRAKAKLDTIDVH